MASKSKKRRRVLGASCILAALIIAGSSFAWFTSKDEVTNRLTASADYNVSIIENFAPPKQWVPGQTVTKEEAVVNTGNIDAFVHQTVSSVLQITVEVPTTEAPSGLDAADYIKLDETEAGTLEAGSYLAFAPEGVDKGNKVISVIPNTEGSAKLTDFNPTKTGLYIFRRAVTVDATTPFEDTKYEYVGYYFVAPTTEEAQAGKTGTYYKLHDIIGSSLVLEEDGNGNLASAPDVTYAKETKETINKAPMVYEAAVTDGENSHGDRLVISYDKNANAATAGLNQQTFEAYRDYLDSLQGKTTWDKGNSTLSNDASNTTGLIDHDEYAQDADEKTPAENYSNYSSKRLETRKGETEDAVELASPKNAANEVDWVTVYNNAKADRKTINEGVKAAEALRLLRTTVEGLIGKSENGTDPGLYQSRASYTDKFHYKATAESMSPADDGAIILMTPTASTGGGQSASAITYDDGTGNETSSALFNMTADTMDQGRFAAYDSEGVKWNVVTKPYGTGAANDSAVKTTWDNYENAVKARMLLEAKIKICNDLAGNSTTSVARITLADDTSVEVGEYKAWLEEQLTTAQQAEATAKAAYDAQQKTVKDDIALLNGYQDKVNAANEVDKGQANATIGTTAVTAIYKGDQSTANSYPSETETGHEGYKSIVLTDATEGSKDSYDEDVLEAYLVNVYGIALKDTSAESKAEYWDGTNFKEQATYSPEVTKSTIDNDLTSNEGKIAWKDSPVLNEDQQADVARSVYYEDKKVGFMKTYRDGITAEKKAAYDAKVKAENLDVANSESGIVKIYVNLDNIGDGSEVDKWQYVPEAATGANEGKDFNFYYTSILGSGDTSKLLIKSLEFDKDVKQDAFRDIQLDLNVTAESAQVVYNGDMAQSTAANASIYGADTEKDEYALTEAVKWKPDTTEVTGDNVITDKDPNPKADANVTP